MACRVLRLRFSSAAASSVFVVGDDHLAKRIPWSSRTRRARVTHSSMFISSVQAGDDDRDSRTTDRSLSKRIPGSALGRHGLGPLSVLRRRNPRKLMTVAVGRVIVRHDGTSDRAARGPSSRRRHRHGPGARLSSRPTRTGEAHDARMRTGHTLLLDLGCGVGSLRQALLRGGAGFGVTCADARPRRTSKPFAVDTRSLPLVRANATALPSRGNAFDAAVLMKVLEHCEYGSSC